MQEPQAKAQHRVWLTYEQASIRTSLHPSTLWRAVRRGDLAVGGMSGAPRFHVDEIDRFMGARNREQ